MVGFVMGRWRPSQGQPGPPKHRRNTLKSGMPTQSSQLKLPFGSNEGSGATAILDSFTIQGGNTPPVTTG